MHNKCLEIKNKYKMRFIFTIIIFSINKWLSMDTYIYIYMYLRYIHYICFSANIYHIPTE